MSDHRSASRRLPSSKRPFTVTILILVVLIFTTLNALRFVSTIDTWTFLSASPVNVPIGYLAVTGAFWALAGSPLALGLFFRRQWSLRLAQILTLLYAVYYWADRLWIAEPNAISIRWPFSLGLTILLLIYTFLVLSHPKVRMFLSK